MHLEVELPQLLKGQYQVIMTKLKNTLGCAFLFCAKSPTPSGTSNPIHQDLAPILWASFKSLSERLSPALRGVPGSQETQNTKVACASRCQPKSHFPHFLANRTPILCISHVLQGRKVLAWEGESWSISCLSPRMIYTWTCGLLLANEK